MKLIRLAIVFLFVSINSHAQQLAFPTAEGAGKFTTGGRGTVANPTKIFIVNSLADDNSAGTLRWALTQTATYRTIVFTVSGTIHLNSKLNIKANTTIAGQTSPAGGICIADYSTNISGDNIIVRYIKCRLGDKNELITTPVGCGVPVAPFTAACMPVNGSGGNDAFGGTGHKNIIIDHCTFSWSNDESCSIYSGDSTTVQWCMMSEPLNYAYHFETGDADFEHHGYGGIWGGKAATFHHNLLAHCQGRACRFDGSRNLGNGTTAGLENCEFSNNVIYNWGAYNVNGGEGGNYNIQNNYYKYGPQTSNKKMVINPYNASPLPWGKYFVSGNYVDGSTNTTNNNWLGAVVAGGSLADTATIKVATAFNGLGINLDNAQAAYTKILANVGASIPSRDTLDARIIGNVKNRTGKIIDCQGGYAHATPYANTVNAWPTLIKGNISTDNDLDGMPNWWEDRNGLNKNLATDRATIAANGYTNLENFIDSIPGWNNHAAYESFTGTKLSNTQAHFTFSTNWVKDSFTYSLFSSPDSLGVYTIVASVPSSMNNIGFNIDDNNLPATTTYYKVGSYRVGVTPDTLYTNIIRIDGILPVKFKSYDAYLINNKEAVVNKWVTATEINTSHFNVQKSSNAKDFKTIGTIAAKGLASDYEFTDNLLPLTVNGYLYYRLQVVDKDGAVSYSDIKKIKLGNNFIAKVYPNPVHSTISIETDEAIKEINVLNILGKKVLQKEVAATNNVQLSVTALPKGTYILQITNNNNESIFEKLVIE